MTPELINERPNIRLIFLLWQKYKKYCDNCFPSVEAYMDMLDMFSRNHTLENSDGRTFNHLFLNAESSIGYDGDSLKSILHYEMCDILKKRLTQL